MSWISSAKQSVVVIQLACNNQLFPSQAMISSKLLFIEC